MDKIKLISLEMRVKSHCLSLFDNPFFIKQIISFLGDCWIHKQKILAEATQWLEFQRRLKKRKVSSVLKNNYPA